MKFKRDFKMHPNLLRQVMEAQSGTIHKAIMEAKLTQKPKEELLPA